MIFAWKELNGILPQWIRPQIRQYEKEPLQEIRLRLNCPPEIISGGVSRFLLQPVAADDLNFCINAASRYSPWTAYTVCEGYITAQGGHRIGLCGESVVKDGVFSGIRTISSLCIRVAHDFPGICRNVPDSAGSILILGAPGWGKTTLLRDIARKKAELRTVAVVDERMELFPAGFRTGRRMDILSGCPKSQGIETVLRTMGPEYIVVDEITAEKDCQAIIHAAFSGVRLIATAHAVGMEDFRNRTVYERLRELKIFDTYLVLHSDKSYHLEAG